MRANYSKWPVGLIRVGRPDNQILIRLSLGLRERDRLAYGVLLRGVP